MLVAPARNHAGALEQIVVFLRMCAQERNLFPENLQILLIKNVPKTLQAATLKRAASSCGTEGRMVCLLCTQRRLC